MEKNENVEIDDQEQRSTEEKISSKKKFDEDDDSNIFLRKLKFREQCEWKVGEPDTCLCSMCHNRWSSARLKILRMVENEVVKALDKLAAADRFGDVYTKGFTYEVVIPPIDVETLEIKDAEHFVL